MIFDGSPKELQTSRDKRVTQFIKGEAGDRLMEMRLQYASAESMLRGVGH